jgi:hypothetical protein
MAGEKRYTRIPPESVGSRIMLKHTVDVSYINKTNPFLIGERVQFSESQLKGDVTRDRRDTSTTGVISLSLDSNSIDYGILPVQGQNILDGNDIIIATVSATPPVEIYTNTTSIVGYGNEYNGLKVDNSGSAQIRFPEGEPTLDAFGRLRIANLSVQGEYAFQEGVNDRIWSTGITGDATLTHDSDTRGIILTTTINSSDTVSYTSDQYHHYTPGIAQTTHITFATGDTGKPNLIRNWGYFDQDNGMMFRLNGIALQAVVRSSVQGSVNDIVIDQDDWNSDTLDGSADDANPSGILLDTSLDNIYWFDMQWLGSGRIRFGIYIEGSRITVHEYQHSNLYPYPNMQTASLPIRIEQNNTGSVGSTSVSKFWCASVVTEAQVNVSDLGLDVSIELEGQLTDNTETFIGAVRPVQFLPSGKINRNLYYPTVIHVGSWDPTAGPVMTKIRAYTSGFLQNGLWELKNFTTIEKNNSADIIVPGLQIAEYYVNGSSVIDASTTFTNPSVALKNKADGTQNFIYFTAQRLYGVNDISVGISVVAKEVSN